MVKRMIVRSLYLAPVLVTVLWLWNGSEWALSGAIGLALTLVNLLVAGRIIGVVAENNPNFLLPAGMIAFGLGLAILFAVGVGLKRTDAVDFPVMGITLIASHLVLVLWEASGAYRHADGKEILSGKPADLRS